MKQMLFINSNDRDTTSASSTNFALTLPDRTTAFDKVKLLVANIPNTVYNIRSAVNDRLDFFNTSDFAITVPPGAYDLTTFMSTIKSLMNAQDANSYDLTFDSTT